MFPTEKIFGERLNGSTVGRGETNLFSEHFTICASRPQRLGKLFDDKKLFKSILLSFCIQKSNLAESPLFGFKYKLNVLIYSFRHMEPIVVLPIRDHCRATYCLG